MIVCAVARARRPTTRDRRADHRPDQERADERLASKLDRWKVGFDVEQGPGDDAGVVAEEEAAERSDQRQPQTKRFPPFNASRRKSIAAPGPRLARQYAAGMKDRDTILFIGCLPPPRATYVTSVTSTSARACWRSSGWRCRSERSVAGVAWCLLRLIGLITNLVFYGRVGTALVSPDGGDRSWLVILLAPIAGGLVIGLAARFGSEKIRGHGIPEAIDAILTSGSKVQPRVALLKPVASAIAIGTGGPFGAEGPIIMTGGAFGSICAQLLHLSADERKTLLVAGAAAGMAAVFDAPLASVLLAVELLLFEWRPRSLVPVAAAVAVAASPASRCSARGPVFPAPTGALHLDASLRASASSPAPPPACSPWSPPRSSTLSEDAFGRLPIHWMWWPALGGLIIGVGGLIVPQALGVGYDVIEAELNGTAALHLIVGILIVKTLIWSLSLGSGTSGGVLAPLLMIGAALGGLEAQVFPAVGAGFWPLVGLAAVLGGAMRLPLTGVVFALELTHRYEALLPLLIGSVAAYLVSVLILRRSILTEKVARRGVHLSREYSVDPLEVLFVGDVMAEIESVARDAERRQRTGDGPGPRRSSSPTTPCATSPTRWRSPAATSWRWSTARGPPRRSAPCASSICWRDACRISTRSAIAPASCARWSCSAPAARRQAGDERPSPVPGPVRGAARLPHRAAPLSALERGTGGGGRPHPRPASAAAGDQGARRQPPAERRRARRLPGLQAPQRGRADRPRGRGRPGRAPPRRRRPARRPPRPHPARRPASSRASPA